VSILDARVIWFESMIQGLVSFIDEMVFIPWNVTWKLDSAVEKPCVEGELRVH
jgi:hypothetical protein